MYEVLEHWKEYQKHKRENTVNNVGVKNQYKKEEYRQMDKFLSKLITKNGVTKY